jgi:hypothetical protein
MYNVNLWRVFVTIVAMEIQTMLSVHIVELYITINNIKLLDVEQQCFYGKSMTRETIKLTRVFM